MIFWIYFSHSFSHSWPSLQTSLIFLSTITCTPCGWPNTFFALLHLETCQLLLLVSKLRQRQWLLSVSRFQKEKVLVQLQFVPSAGQASVARALCSQHRGSVNTVGRTSPAGTKRQCRHCCWEYCWRENAEPLIARTVSSACLSRSQLCCVPAPSLYMCLFVLHVWGRKRRQHELCVFAYQWHPGSDAERFWAF